MAEFKVPFGHDGFKNRSNKVSFKKESMSENVAWNKATADPVRKAVNGWINSPGHRKNLLGDSNLCGIGIVVFESD